MNLHIRIGLLMYFSFLGLAQAQISPGPLSQAHAHLEGISNCTQCHDIGNKVPDSKCLACHTEIQDLINAGRGYHAHSDVRNGACIDCHSDHHGRKFEMARFDQDAFDHKKTGYQLEGQHAVIDCRSCHSPENIPDREIRNRAGTFLGLEHACLNCHDDFHQGTLPKDCAECHDFNAFRPASLFEHDRTEFPLKGRHEQVDCAGCHAVTERNGQPFQQFSGIAFSDCVSCHTDEHQGQLPGKCAQCHNETAFDLFSGQNRFDHQLTPFELKGKHRTTSCFLCHKNTFDPRTIFQDMKGTDERACLSCHDDIHEGRFGTDCAKCHQETSFKDLRSMEFFDHDVTDFPLEGKHEAVDCKECHQGSFTQPMDFAYCMDCHSDYHEGQFTETVPPRDCAECHSVDGFEETLFGFDQHQQTEFPLEGAHMATPCLACHLVEDRWVFVDLGKECIACHEDVHEGLISDKYYPQDDCRACHHPEAWYAVDFDHSATDWELEGAHADTECRACHFREVDGETVQQFSGISSLCQNCHDNNHMDQFEIGGSTDCTRCHTSLNWDPTLFDHNLTSFPLDGRHAEVACRECHSIVFVEGIEMIKYKLESFQCIDCHY